MKCPDCNYNQLRGQSGMKCKSCGYRFIFDPKSHHCGSKSLTDGYFIKCIDQLSRKNTYFYTEDELYCFMAKRAKNSIFELIAFSLFITFVLTILLEISLDTGIAVSFIILPTVFALLFFLGRKGLTKKRWTKHLKRWKKYSSKYQHKNDVLAGLISTPQLTENPATPAEPDMYDYGASKLIICEQDIQVDWLVMNKFHSQNGVVVIAESGYPHYLTDQVKQLITTNPELEIFLLHNSGANGEAMMNRVKSISSQWNLSQHNCIDLGLSREQITKSGIKKKTIEQYHGDYPAHGLGYHQFSSLLCHSVVNGVALSVAFEVFSANSDSGVSFDFG